MNEGGTLFFLRLDLYASLESVFQDHNLLESRAAFVEVIGLESFETTGMSFLAYEGAEKAPELHQEEEFRHMCEDCSEKPTEVTLYSWDPMDSHSETMEIDFAGKQIGSDH